MTYSEALTQLDTEGLRIAMDTESAWNWTYINENGERVTLRVTEK